MRLDHIAYRVKNRHKAAKFFQEAFGYKLAESDGELKNGEFTIEFKNPDGSTKSTTKCVVLVPPEKSSFSNVDWTWEVKFHQNEHHELVEFHTPPEIFISDGESEAGESIVGKWVEARSGIGGIHHLAYQVDSVEEKMKEWKEKGYAEFSSEEPLTCPGLVQVFTKPSELTGVIYEFIERGKHGFCRDNVRDLMLSTKDFS